MTSFVAWVGVDSRGPTSFYFASDSRISWGKDPKAWDCGRKVFASQTHAEIFGFVGYALLPQSILQRSCNLIDQSLRPEGSEMTAKARAEWLYARIESETKPHPGKFMDAFTVFHGIRMGIGKPGQTNFHMFATSWTPKQAALTMVEISVPSKGSSILHIDGSGRDSVQQWSDRWRASDQGNTSRTIFSAFCDSLASNADPHTGGEPQLVGIYRKNDARTFGVVSKNGPSFQGMLNPGIRDDAPIQWRDALFQRVAASGVLLKNAQRHSRPKQLILT